jgi:hypothetical protein
MAKRSQLGTTRSNRTSFWKLRDKDWLENEHTKNKKTQKEIAKELGCSQSNVQIWIKKHKIQPRQPYRWTKNDSPIIHMGREKFCEQSKRTLTKTQKKRHAWKNDIKLTKKQRAIILGSLLGDMFIGIPPKGGKNACISMQHALKQEQYLRWKYNELRELFLAQPRYVKPSGFGGKGSLAVQSMCIKCLTEINNVTKINKQKTVTTHWIKQLQNLGEQQNVALAIWAMDDGTAGKHQFGFVVGDMEKTEIELLRTWLNENWKIQTTHRKTPHTKQRIEIFGRENLNRLYNAIEKTIKTIPVMEYKLRFMEYKEKCEHETTKNGRCAKCGRFVTVKNER